MNAKAVLAVALIAVIAACRDPAIPFNAEDVPLVQMGPPAQPGYPRPGYYQTSGFHSPARLVIRDQQAWEEAWATLMNEQPGESTPLPVDFQTDMVLLAAMGAQNGGSSIALDDAAKTEDMFYISVTETTSGDRCITIDMIVTPAALVRVPRFDGEVKFIENTATHNCF